MVADDKNVHPAKLLAPQKDPRYGEKLYSPRATEPLRDNRPLKIMTTHEKISKLLKIREAVIERPSFYLSCGAAPLSPPRKHPGDHPLPHKISGGEAVQFLCGDTG